MTPGDLSDLLQRLQAVEAFMRQVQHSGALRWMPPTVDIIESRVFFNSAQTRDGSNWRWEYTILEYEWTASDSSKWPLPTAKSGSPTRKAVNAYELGNTADANVLHNVNNGTSFTEIKPVKTPLVLCHLVRCTGGKDPRWMFWMPNEAKC